jgi:oxalate decarboxylase
VVDSQNFLAAKHIAVAWVTIKPGGMGELHGHPTVSVWQYYISHKARVTVFTAEGFRTMDFNENDVGFVPKLAGHYVENTGKRDLEFLEMFAASEYMDFSLNNWIRDLPPEMITSHLNLDAETTSRIPAENFAVIPG